MGSLKKMLTDPKLGVKGFVKDVTSPLPAGLASTATASKAYKQAKAKKKKPSSGKPKGNPERLDAGRRRMQSGGSTTMVTPPKDKKRQGSNGHGSRRSTYGNGR